MLLEDLVGELEDVGSQLQQDDKYDSASALFRAAQKLKDEIAAGWSRKW